jgi:hypothetical protein
LTDKTRKPGAGGENRFDRVNFVNFTRAHPQFRFDVNFVNFGPSADRPIPQNHRGFSRSHHRHAPPPPPRLAGWTAAAPVPGGSSTKQPKYRTRP